jgi:chromosome segregation ATPase
MSEKNDMDLIIGMGDDEGMGSFSGGHADEAGLQSLRRKVAFLSIAFILIIIALSFLGHRILSARLGDIHSAGEKESRTLSQSLEAGLEALDARQDALEKKLESYQKGAKAREKKIESSISLLNQGLYKARSLYSPKKEFEESREKTDAKIAALGQGLKDASLRMDKRAENMDKRAGKMEERAEKIAAELAEGLEAASRRLKDMADEMALAQADISSLAADKANKKDLREEVSKTEKASREALGKIEERMASLKGRTGRLEKATGEIETLAKKIDKIDKIDKTDKITVIEKRLAAIQNKMGALRRQMDSIRKDISKIDDIQSDLYFQKQETDQIKKMLSPAPGNAGETKSGEAITETEIKGGD